jgi:hypothetical protein
LNRISPKDRSPRTGTGPQQDEHHRSLWFYGALDFDHKAIGAPIGVDPASRDPIYPGVLVRTSVGDDCRTSGTMILDVGHPGNTRDGTGVLDGVGTIMVAYRITRLGFSGVWGSDGMGSDGSGVFCARLKRVH